MRSLFLVLLMLGGLAANADDYRIYDEKGAYRGKAVETEEGRFRVYDHRGRFQGRIERKRDGSFKRYDRDGKLQDRIEGDD